MLCALAWFAYGDTLQLGMLGWDSWPLIAAARITDGASFLGTFTEELMDGRYTDGHFYRPLTNLSVALDHLLWGLNPKGYHLTDLAICVLNAFLLGALVRRLCGPRFVVAGVVASVVFLLHPVQLNVLPVMPRRADTLAVLFTLATLLTWPRAEGRRWPAVLFAACAMLSKESGIVVVPLVLALAGLRAQPDRRSALRATWPVLLATVLFLGARTLVLGGLGGHGGATLALARELAEPYLRLVLYPTASEQNAELSALVAVTTIALGLAAAFVWRRPGTSAVGERADIRTTLGLLAVWFVVLHLVSSLAGRLHDWYALAYVAPFAILVGILIDRGIQLLREREWGPAGMCVAPALGVFALQVGTSELVRTDYLWIDADAITRNTLSRLQTTIRKSVPGTRVYLEDVVLFLPDRRSPGSGRGAAVLTDYSMQAWCDLHVDADVLIRILGTAPAAWSSETLMIECIPGAPPLDE